MDGTSEKKSKQAIDAPRMTVFMLDPEKLTLVDDQSHVLHCDRVHDEAEEPMIRNIMVLGVTEPILIRKNGEDVYEVIDGRSRVKAAREANKRLIAAGEPPIRVRSILCHGDDAHMLSLLISMNEIRREDSPLARADKARRFIDIGRTEEEAAIIFGVTRQTIRNWLTLQDLSTPIRKAVQEHEITATAAAQLAGLSQDDQKARLDELKAAGGRITVRRAKSSARTGDDRPARRMRNKQEIIKEINSGTAGTLTPFAEGYVAGLRWVINELVPTEKEGVKA